MINETKVSQMAAYLLLRRGSRMSILKLVKMLYLADRESLTRYGFSMSGDNAVSMDHGPALSATLDLLNGCMRSQPGGWEHWVSDRENHEVSLAREADFDDLDELSEADQGVLDTIWNKFGNMSRWEIVDYTHEQCPEWENPYGSSNPIPFKRILGFTGWKELAEEQSKEIERQDRVGYIFSVL